jgi:glucose/arabinose dehydrogenase
VGDPQVPDPIWAFGLREPWRFSFDRRTGDLWLGDVGQGHSEEIDVVRYGPGGWGGPVMRNFGWRCMEGSRCTGLSGCVCHAPELIAPVASFDHSVGCAVIGGHVYRGCAIPALRGWYVYATFCYGSASRVFAFPADDPVGSPTVELTAALAVGASGIERITSFGEDVQGELYYCLLEGVVRKIVPAAPFADCNANGVPDSCDLALGTSADLDGNGKPDECDHRPVGPAQPAPRRTRP